MKVVSEPPKMSPWQYRCTCGATLEATEEDVRKKITTQWDQRDGNYNVTEYVTVCPLCNNATKVPTMPYGWQALHKDVPVIK